MKKFFWVLLVCFLGLTSNVSGQDFKGAFNKVKSAAKQKLNKDSESNTTDLSNKTIGNSNNTSSRMPVSTQDIYVSTKGSNRNTGGKSDPYKDIQKAIDEAPEGATIHIAKGNYLGKLNVGYIEVKKYVSLIGGYSEDFSERNPIKYRTSIQPPADAGGTNANHGLIDIFVSGNRNGSVVIDGFYLDKGQMNKYVSLTPTDPKFNAPEGCETGILNPPAIQISQPSMRGVTTVSNQLIHGETEGNVTIKNCVFLNGSHFAIQMGNMGGHIEICNNVFLANRMAACEVRGMNRDVSVSSLSFHHNTVLFTWRRDWVPGGKDMGYAFRFMTRINSEVYNNIIGCSDFAALDRTFVDSDINKERERKTSAYDNLFFSNIEADLTLPSGGGKFLRIFSDMFEDVDELYKADGNREMSESEVETFSKSVNSAYLKGFLNMEGSSSSDYNPNSSENFVRSIFGMNQRGTESNSVTMYANSYPIDDAGKLFGAIKGYGAQSIR